MTQKKSNRLAVKAITIIALICILTTSIQPTPVVAQEIPTATTTPEVSAPSSTATTLPPEVPVLTETPPPPTLMPSIILEATAEMAKTFDFSAAGEGTYFRALVSLNQPHDLARLEEWNIKVLEKYDGYAYVMADNVQLEKLARLGFDPSEVNSLEYMAYVYNAMKGASIMSAEDLISSPQKLISLSSVDTDNDGLTDSEEAWWCTDPNKENSDFDGTPSSNDPNDSDEVNAILKGITSYGPPFAMWPNFKPHHADGDCQDGDFDGVPDNAELYMIGTSPQRESSDLDKFDDGQELFGVTYCPGTSGPCGYGILPRAEDAAFVSANLPAWVKEPGNSPFVAAFPEPEVEVVPSSLNLTRVATITTSEGTMQGTEKTYGTSSTKGTSTSVADTVTWNQWEEVSHTTPDMASSNLKFYTSRQVDPNLGAMAIIGLAGVAATLMAGAAPAQEANMNIGDRICQKSGFVRDWLMGCNYHRWLYGPPINTGQNITNVTKNYVQQTYNVTKCNVSAENQSLATCGNLAVGVYSPNSSQTIAGQSPTTNSQDLMLGQSGTGYYLNSNNQLILQPQYLGTYPVPAPTTTISQGKEWGGSHTTTSTQYEEQTISESSTKQYSQTWENAQSSDTNHSADLRFTYNIVNNGTEYAREVTSLTFNIYIGNNPNPAYTYVAVGATGQIAKVENLFPGDSLTYTSNPIELTLDEMRAIDEGAPIRIVMEDISFGQDQVFYLDALNGSVTVAMEDGYDDLDETVDTYLVPVWDPSDTVQDVAKRYFPVIEDADSNLLAVFTPELASNIPSGCVQDTTIAPASNTMVYCKHALTGTSWWNFYLSDGLSYSGVFKDTSAAPNTAMLVRIVSDRDLDGYNDRNEIKLGMNPDDPAEHPAPNLLAGYTKSCTDNDCTLCMTFQNLGNYDAYGIEAVLYSPDGLATITNNTIGGSGRVPAGTKVVIGPTDTFQYTTSAGAAEPVIIVSYNDPQGNHRFILPTGTYPSGALITDLNADISGLNGKMLPDPGVDISSTGAGQASFVVNTPHPTPITNAHLFVETVDVNGNVLNEEDIPIPTLESGPTVITRTFSGTDNIILVFFTDSQGNIIDSSARPLASFGADPAPEANLTTSSWMTGKVSIMAATIEIPDPWNIGIIQSGTTLYATLNLANTGLGDLRYSLSGFDGNLTLSTGSPAGTLGPSQTHSFGLAIDTAGIPAGSFTKSLTLRTNDPNHGTVSINIAGTAGTVVAGNASAYAVSQYHPWDQYVYVPGPHNQNDVVTFTHTLADDPTRMFPLYLYSEDGSNLKGVGEYGVDFSGQTAPFSVFGTGTDSDLAVAYGETKYTDNTRSALASTANSGQLNLALASSSDFANGQEVLVIQIQGTGAGRYEFGTIANVSSNTLTLSKNLANTYTVGGNSKVQVIRVMQYHDVTVQSGGVLTAHAWDGNSGGVIAFRSSGLTSINAGGVLNSSAIGFRGGVGGVDSQAYTGEGTQSPSAMNTTNPPGNGGGTQHVHCAGGGNGTAGGSGGASTVGDPDGNPELTIMVFGGGGGAGAVDPASGAGVGGIGGGITFIASRQLIVSGNLLSTGGNGGSVPSTGRSGCGGAGGSILIKSKDITLGTNLVSASEGLKGTGGTYSNSANGGMGRIRIEYSTFTGTTNPIASVHQVNYYSVTGQDAPFGVFGNSSDSDLTVTTGQTAYTDNIRYALASTASAGQANITLSNVTGFVIGKEVLIIQSQGIGVGNYEFAAITNINGNIFTLSKSLANTYTTGGNSRAQVLLVPQYNNLTVQSGSILTCHNWDGNTGGIIAFRVSGSTNILGTILASGNPATNQTGGIGSGFAGGNGTINSSQPAYYGEGITGAAALATSGVSNGNGGGGGRGSYTQNSPAHDGAGGGGGNSTIGGTGLGNNHAWEASGGITAGNTSLSNIVFGGGGGGGSSYNAGGGGGGGGGIVFLFSRIIDITGTVNLNGGNGSGTWGSGGGGAGGSALISGQTINIGNNLITATGAPAIGSDGAVGGDGRIRIEYTYLNGTANPSASTQQVNYFNLTGSATGNLYIPDSIPNNNNIRYQLLYGQRGSNTTGGDQTFSAHLPNRQYSTINMSALIERVAGSGSTFNFCLDIGNDGICEYTANNQTFIGPVRLDSTNFANALNAYITAQQSSANTLVIPIRVNIDTPADIFLFNLIGSVGNDTDLQPSAPVITPPNGNPPSNIPEGSLVDLSSTITNHGSYKAENFTVGFYLGDPAAGGTLIGSTFVSSLAAGETSAAQTVDWNTSGLLGGQTIFVKADVSDSLHESNETNNIASSPSIVKKKADLVMTNISVPNVRQNETGVAGVTVKNDGQADVTGTVVKLYLGTDDTGTVLGSTTLDVPQGQSTSGQIAFSINAAGPHPIFVKADPDNLVLEASETNNTASANTLIGWDSLSIDTGGNNDILYDAVSSEGYGRLTQGTAVTTCGTNPEQSYRQAGSAESLDYQFDNLLPDRYYHLDLTFVVCSGTRNVKLRIEDQPISEPGDDPLNPVIDREIHITDQVQTVSLLLKPTDYTDGKVKLSIIRSSGLSGPMVNLIGLSEVQYCSVDSGPGEQPWSPTNNCGFDPSATSDGFNGWGTAPHQTVRFSETGQVKYKFSSLDPAKDYNVRLTFFEGDAAGRNEQLLFDATSSQTINLSSTPGSVLIAIPSSTYSDGEVTLTINEINGDSAVISEVVLEENTGGSPIPQPPTPTPTFTPTFTPSPTPTNTPLPIVPQVTLSAFGASWSGPSVQINWSTTTEINNSDFVLYRSPDTLAWAEVATVHSNRPCGNYASTSPVNYSYTDTAVNGGSTYYYRLQFSGAGCGGHSVMSAQMVSALPTPAEFVKTDPLNNAINQNLNLMLSWEASAQATSYEYCFDTTNDNDCSSWINNGNSTTKSLSGLSAGTTYYWQVRAVNIGGMTYANNEIWWSFTTLSDMPPAVLGITRASADPTNAASVNFTVTFSESVTGVDKFDFNLVTPGEISGATITSVGGSGATRTVVVGTGTGSGSIHIDLIDNDTIKDVSLNKLGGVGLTNGDFITGESYTIDKTPPTVVSIVRASPNPNGSASVNFTVTFSEVVSAVDKFDFLPVTTGTLTDVTVISVGGAGVTRTVTVSTGTGVSTGVNSGTLRLDLIDNDTIQDGVLNKLGGIGTANGDFTSGEIYSIEKPPASVISISRTSATPTGSSLVGFTVTFSEAVTGVDRFDFSLVTTDTLSGVAIQSVGGTGITRTVTVNTGTGSGTLHLDLIDNDTIKDAANKPLGGVGLGNGNFTSGATYTIEKTPPSVLSIVRSSANPTGAASVKYTVTFSEAVVGVDMLDFNVVATGTLSGVTITSLTGTGTTRTLTLSTGTTGSGTIHVDLIDNDSIKDTILNPLGGVGATNGNFTSGETYTIDKTAPIVVSIVRASPDPTNAASVTFLVTFSKAVTGVDKFDFSLVLTDTLTSATVTSVGGTGTTRTVTVNTGTGSGTLRLDLIDNNTIKDSFTNLLGGPGLLNGDFRLGETYTVR
ncbi:MAG: hypothetical protein HY863_11460 [Chloroflexi bacterium]|nr:hypothetical protein [Chloroflexota bacterium]